MIDEIQVQNLALIKQADLCFSEGLTVLTGETGAGKTALLSALKLLMGSRSDKTQVREGEKELVVTGLFHVESALNPVEREAGGEAAYLEESDGLPEENEGSGEAQLGSQSYYDEEGNCVVRRTVAASGRSKVSVNGMLASTTELQLGIASSIDLCGQHEHQQLLKPLNHLRLLDIWAHREIKEALNEYREAFDASLQARQELEDFLRLSQESQELIEKARFELAAIMAVDPTLGEYEQLCESVERAQYAADLIRVANEVHGRLCRDAGVLEELSGAFRELSAASVYDARLASFAQSIQDANYVLEDLSVELSSYLSEIDLDEEELAYGEERIAAYQGLMRNYGPRIEDVLERKQKAETLLEATEDSEERIRVLERALDEAEEVLGKRAKHLAERRQQVYPLFIGQVNAQMDKLEMKSAEVVCGMEDLERKNWTRDGSQKIELLFKPGTGMQARPFARIASGGEVSRVMLAIKAVMGATDKSETLVFDEVDAGVGGATALSLARLLKELSASHQVIVVTHLPQVAAQADVHFLVEKTEGEQPFTSLRQLNDEERVGEVARMLSGQITDRSLAHAKELLEGVECYS